MSASLEDRVGLMRGRLQVRAWEYRQRKLAKGVWMLLRRSLADAARAFVIPEDDAKRLMAEGVVPEPAGLQVEPTLYLLFVRPIALASIARRREVAVDLRLLQSSARFVALIPFEGTRRSKLVDDAAV